jgi:small-conductance mechanosensitive channel
MLEFSNLTSELLASKLAASLAIVALAVAMQMVLRRSMLRYMTRADLRRRWMVGLRNIVVLLALVGLAAIWMDELRAFATAVVAFAVAFVIATKEFILCINGSFLRATTNAYVIGDRISIDGHRGDVVDLTLFSTTLLEVGPGDSHHLRTGRTVVIPNSLLLSHSVVNESSMKPYVLHVFSVPVEGDWTKAEKILLESAEAEAAPFLADAKERMRELEAKHSLDGLPTQPRVHVQIPEAGKVFLLVRTPTPIGRQGAIEQAILRTYLKRLAAESSAEGWAAVAP